DRLPRSSKCSVEGIWPSVVPVPVLICVHQREHGPTIGIARGLLNGPFQTGCYFGKVFRGEALVVAEATQQCFVWAHLIGSLQPNHFAHAARKNSMDVGNGGDDPRHEFVLQIKESFRAEGAFISIGPEMSA